MNKPVSDVLKAIDTLLAKGNQDSHALWDVISALRGPDTGTDDMTSYEVKRITTTYIRNAALPKTAKTFLKSSLPITFATSDDNENSASLRWKITGHFGYHASSAFEALGLEWRTINSPEKIKNATKVRRK